MTALNPLYSATDGQRGQQKHRRPSAQPMQRQFRQPLACRETRFLLEQDALLDVLAAQSAENAERIPYDTAIDAMAAVESIEPPAVRYSLIA